MFLMAYVNPLGALLKLVRVPSLIFFYLKHLLPLWGLKNKQTNKENKINKKTSNKQTKKQQKNKPLVFFIIKKNITKCSSYQYKKFTISSPRGFRYAVKF